MTETLKIGMEAINKWVFHAWNYETTEVEIPDHVNGGFQKIHVPQFIAEAKWTCNISHMINKWLSAICQSYNTDAYLVTFYANLDNENRQILLEWILENYSDEQKLF